MEYVHTIIIMKAELFSRVLPQMFTHEKLSTAVGIESKGFDYTRHDGDLPTTRTHQTTPQLRHAVISASLPASWKKDAFKWEKNNETKYTEKQEIHYQRNQSKCTVHEICVT